MEKGIHLHASLGHHCGKLCQVLVSCLQNCTSSKQPIKENLHHFRTFYLLLITQPKYFKEVFGLDLTEGSFLAALPHFVMTLIVPFGGQLADYLRRKQVGSNIPIKKFKIVIF